MKLSMHIGALAGCIAVSLGGLAVAVWVLVSGMPGREGIDAMFLLVIGLAFAAFFGVYPVRTLRRRKSAVNSPKTEVRSDRTAKA